MPNIFALSADNLSDGSLVISYLSIYILPEVGRMIPHIRFNKVVFPEPIVPFAATISPGSISKFILENIYYHYNSY